MNLLKLIQSTIADFFEAFAIAGVIFIVVYVVLARPYVVEGNSMEPTFSNRDYLIIDKVSYTLSSPHRGDIIVFTLPNFNEDLIKRIIGLPGDRVKIVDGRYYVNGLPLDESQYLPKGTETLPDRYLSGNTELTIPADTYFVSGDNRKHSSDSRYFGPIPKNSIVGKVWLRWWPFSKFWFIQHGNSIKDEDKIVKGRDYASLLTNP